MIKSKVLFPEKTIGREILNRIVGEQTKRLIDYAESEIKSIGTDIEGYSSTHNMDRTGNLLDSLCWAVFYKGNLKKYGYYRREEAIEDSYLHEYSRNLRKSVNGHFFASQFIANYSPKETGWELIFAIAAPYWGYWEKGHTNAMSNKWQQWSVMTRHYDVVKGDLAPSKVTFNTYVPNY